jgi:hypothetical protein
MSKILRPKYTLLFTNGTEMERRWKGKGEGGKGFLGNTQGRSE